MTREPQQSQESESRPMMSGGGGSDWFAAAVARTPVGLALIDRHARVHNANLAFQKMFAGDEGGGAAFEITDRVDPRDRDRVLRLISDSIAGTAPATPVEIRMVGDEDRLAWLFVDTVQGGSAAELVASVIDVGAVRRLDRRQLVAEKLQAVRQLAAGVAHNLNNRLTSMIGNADLLIEGYDESDPARADATEIRQEADHAAALVKELSSLADPQVRNVERLNLNTVVEDLRPLLDRVAGHDIDTFVDCDSTKPMVRADLESLEQVLIDLIISARDRMAEGGAITIRTRAAVDGNFAAGGQADYRYVEICDNGTPLSDAQLERMFEPFYSASGPFTSSNLGLAAAYGIIRRIGGEIVASGVTGGGTIVRVLLPDESDNAAVESSDAALDASKMSDNDEPGAGRLTVLVVEDELPVRRFAVRALGKRGYAVIEAENGDVALEILDDAATRVDLVVSDVMMPGMDGATLLHEIRARRPSVSVIMISGYGENILRGVLAQHVGVQFLPKPFTLDELVAKVEEALG